MLITSLIMSDLFAAVVNITRTVYEIWLERRLQSRPIAFILIIGSYDALMISFVTIFLISVEHLLAITHPIKLKILVTKKQISVIIISTWLGCTTILDGAYHLPGYKNELFPNDYSMQCFAIYCPTNDLRSSFLFLETTVESNKGSSGWLLIQIWEAEKNRTTAKLSFNFCCPDFDLSIDLRTVYFSSLFENISKCEL
jgi:hypothetical protein